jgi:hypothetical protein
MRTRPPNKGMKLTKLSAAWLPEWTCRLMPAPVNRVDAGGFAAYPQCSKDELIVETATAPCWSWRDGWRDAVA